MGFTVILKQGSHACLILIGSFNPFGLILYSNKPVVHPVEQNFKVILSGYFKEDQKI